MVDEVRIVDSHEHLPPEEQWIRAPLDAINFFANSPAHRDDLNSSGIKNEDLAFITNRKNSLNERWTCLKPYYQKIKNTGYTKAFKIALKDIYGIVELNRESFEKLNHLMNEVRREGFYEKVLKKIAKIDYVINNSPTINIKSKKKKYFLPVIGLDNFVTIQDKMNIKHISQNTGIKINSLEDLLNAVNTFFNKIKTQVVGLKFITAYHRTLNFDSPSYEDANRGLKEVTKIELPKERQMSQIDTISDMPIINPNNEIKALQDYMINHILNLAGESNLPVQFHTGLLGGPSSFIDHSNPVLMSNMYIRHRKTNFVLLHCFPYVDELGALAKMFPNVYIDMAWFNMISPTSARDALSEWIDLLPINKILAFGGDEHIVEVAYGHSVIARDTVSRVLCEKIESGDLSQKEASFIAQRLLRENAYELFLSNKI